MKICLLTNDVESTSLRSNNMNNKTAELVYEEGLPRLLNLYKKYNIKSTFFFTGEILEIIPEVVSLVLPDGHEIASHGYSHDIKEAFDVLDYDTQVKHLIKSKNLLEKLANDVIISFRAPALRVNNFTAKALIKTGFKIDSSIASQRFDFFLSFGGIKKTKWFFSPRLPYFTNANNLFQRGNSDLLEIPISAIIFPYISTTLRIFPKTTKLFRHFLILESKINNKPKLLKN